MHRIDSPTRAQDLFGLGKDGYTEGEPGVTPATETTDDHLNAIQEELTGVVEGVGLVLEKSDNNQVFTAIKQMLAGLAIRNPSAVAAAAGASDDFYGVCFSSSLGLLCAVGLGSGVGIINTSSNGLDWVSRSPSGTPGQLASVCFGNGLFVTVGNSGAIQTSPDGTTWTACTPGGGSTSNLQRVRWCDAQSIFVAVGSGGDIQTSPDGITWTKRTAASSFAGIFYGAAGNDDLIAITGQTNGTTAEIQTSPDGVTWTSRVCGASYNGIFSDVVWCASASRFIAAGYDGEIQTSPDGITWSEASASLASHTFQSALCHGSMVAVCGYTGAYDHIVRVSEDGGLTWDTTHTGLTATSKSEITSNAANRFFYTLANNAIGASLSVKL